MYWSNFKDNPVYRVRCLRTMAAYYFFVRNDIVKAAAFWKEVLLDTTLEVTTNNSLKLYALKAFKDCNRNSVVRHCQKENYPGLLRHLLILEKGEKSGTF